MTTSFFAIAFVFASAFAVEQQQLTDFEQQSTIEMTEANAKMIL